MPTLNWIGKDKVINHHLDVPYHVLDHKYSFSGDENEGSTGNKVIHGDNLIALKSLLPEYEGKIKCIYIDPPYNTGNENWVYNDNVSDPKLQKWLGQVVGKESEDLSRHDKWLCMMYPRLKLLHKLLTDDGVIVVHIDDYEVANLSYCLDEIFGRDNRLGFLVWDLRTGTSAGHFTRAHEYLLVFAKNKSRVDNFSGGSGVIDDRAIKKIGFKNPATDFEFPAGVRVDSLEDFELRDSWGGAETMTIVNGRFICKDGRLAEKVTLRAGWTQKKQMQSWFSNKETFDSKGQRVIEFYFRPNGKLYCKKQRDKINLPSILRDIATSKTGTNEINEIFQSNIFNHPKPSVLVASVISLITTEQDIILDSFAGSGTTAHAVLNLNKEDGGNRKFILIEREDYAESITAERVRRVIKGYGDKEGTGGGFDFYELGPSLFTEDDELNELVGIEKLREYIYFSETRQHLIPQKSDNEYFLSNLNGVSYYFLYEQDLITCLDYKFLSTVKIKASTYIVYADTCTLSPEFMITNRIVFKKIPRDISKF